MELETLRSDMIAAMKAKDKARKEAISSLISAAKKVAIDEGCRDDIKPELVDRVILKELKTVKEQIDTCPASREDLKAEYQFCFTFHICHNGFHNRAFVFGCQHVCEFLLNVGLDFVCAHLFRCVLADDVIAELILCF